MPILIEVLISLIAALLSLAGSSFVLNARAERVLKKAVRKILGLPPEEEPPSYSDRLEKLTSSLIKASREMDGLLHELADVARERQENIGKIDADLRQMQDREKELEERIQHLQNVPLPVAEHFAKLTTQGETRSAKRDYMLFGAGVIVSTVIAIILKLIGLGKTTVEVLDLFPRRRNDHASVQ